MSEKSTASCPCVNPEAEGAIFKGENGEYRDGCVRHDPRLLGFPFWCRINGVPHYLSETTGGYEPLEGVKPVGKRKQYLGEGWSARGRPQ